MDDSPEFFIDHNPIVDEIDCAILMHRDAHFSGLFPIMLDYYRENHKGVQQEFSIERIERLMELEKESNQNLAGLLLGGFEAEKVAEARDAYRKLRLLYESKNPKTPYPTLIADLIFSEEEEPEAEIAAIIAHKEKIVPFLIDLIRSEQFYDPLFPGYGTAPFLAVKCLEKVGDKRAIVALFEAIGKGDFFGDEQMIKALKSIGEPAKHFLLRVLYGKMINEDNERAAIALIEFKDDPEVAESCFRLFCDPEVQKDPCLPTYLISICAGLNLPDLRQEFENYASQLSERSLLKKDMECVVKEWKS